MGKRGPSWRKHVEEAVGEQRSGVWLSVGFISGGLSGSVCEDVCVSL